MLITFIHCLQCKVYFCPSSKQPCKEIIFNCLIQLRNLVIYSCVTNYLKTKSGYLQLCNRLPQSLVNWCII